MKLYPYFYLIFVCMSVVSNATHPLLLAWLEIIEASQKSLSVEHEKKEHQQKNNNMNVMLLHRIHEHNTKQQKKLPKAKRTLPRNKD